LGREGDRSRPRQEVEPPQRDLLGRHAGELGELAVAALG
jgi:hypothetical protein